MHAKRMQDLYFQQIQPLIEFGMNFFQIFQQQDNGVDNGDFFARKPLLAISFKSIWIAFPTWSNFRKRPRLDSRNHIFKPQTYFMYGLFRSHFHRVRRFYRWSRRWLMECLPNIRIICLIIVQAARCNRKFLPAGIYSAIPEHSWSRVAG